MGKFRIQIIRILTSPCVMKMLMNFKVLTILEMLQTWEIVL